MQVGSTSNSFAGHLLRGSFVAVEHVFGAYITGLWCHAAPLGDAGSSAKRFDFSSGRSWDFKVFVREGQRP